MSNHSAGFGTKNVEDLFFNLILHAAEHLTFYENLV